MCLNKRYITLLITIIFTALTVFSASVNISIQSQSRNGKINVNDKFYIIIKMSGVIGQGTYNIPGAIIMGDYYQDELINNNMRGEHSILCRAQKPGNYKFGPIVINGVKSNVVKYSIGGNASDAAIGPQSKKESSENSQSQNNSGPKFIGKGDGKLFMRASVSRTSAYEQEALVYTVKLYTTYERIKFLGATASPKFEGFVIEESKQTDVQMHFESYNGKNYYSAVIARYVIFPQMTGNLTVKGNTYTVSVDEQEYYNEGYFGRLVVNRPLQLSVAPNDLNIIVKQLPHPKPTDFSGGVGKFSISSKLHGNVFKTGDAASITYTVSGTGNLKYIVLPDLENIYPKELEISSPEIKIDANSSGNTVAGTATFEYTFMPTEIGDFKIPDVKLVYYNPESGKYETAVAKGYHIKVEKGKSSGKSQRAHKVIFDSQIMSVDSLNKDYRPYIYSLLYWLSYILPVVALVIILISYRKYIKANSDITAVLSRKANKMAQKRLRKAAACMSANDTDKFYDEMLHALWGYISFKMKIPTSELNRENVSNILSKAGIFEDRINQFINLIDDCEFAKFSSASSSTSMRTMYDAAVTIINNLEESFKRKSHEK